MDQQWPKSVNPDRHEMPVSAPVDAEVLRFAGHLLYGDKWHRPLAEALGNQRGKSVLVQMVYQWDALKKPIPSWVNIAIVHILEDGKTDLRRRADTIQELSTRIWVLTQALAVRGTMDFNDPEER